MKMTDKEILNIYDQGPAAVVKLVRGLLEVIDKQNEIIERQNKVIEQQSKRIESLEKRVRDLESRLNKNSQNSSKPPSTDMFRKNQNNSREKTDKHSGGQTGHKPHRLELSDHPDKIIVHKAKKCSHCNRSLRNVAAMSLEKRQLFEIPVIRLKVIEHRSEVKLCRFCNKLTKALFPDELPKTVQYGKGVYSFIAACQNLLMLPYERTSEFFSHLFNHTISEGTIKNINERLYRTLENTELKIKQAIIASEAINQDETGIYIEGKRQWLHASSTKDLTFYQHHKKRGKKAFNAIGIIPVYKGNLIHDYWKPYIGYRNCKHFLCNAHHLRELKFIVEQDPKQKWAKEMRTLLKKMKRAVDKAKNNSKETLSPYLQSKYEHLYDNIISKAMKQTPLNRKRTSKRGAIKQTTSRLLAQRFRDSKVMIIGFLHDFNIPFDNNLVERDIRMMKLKQKISGCFRCQKKEPDTSAV